MYTLYILKTSSSTYYTGITNNLEKRINEHKNKGSRSSKYMKSFKSFDLVYTEKLKDRSSALKRECEIKKLTKPEKEALISMK